MPVEKKELKKLTAEEERFKLLFEEADREKKEFLKNNPDFVPDADFWEAHSCSRFADSEGCCEWCGGVVFGSSLYKELYGGE